VQYNIDCGQLDVWKITMEDPTPTLSSVRKRTGQLSGLQIMFAAILAIGLILGLNFTSLISSSQPLQRLHQQVTEEIDVLRQEQVALIRERDNVQSDAFVEQWARSDGKMVRPGEVLVNPVPSAAIEVESTDSQAIVQVDTLPPDPIGWHLWWQLFFDGPPPAF
jgi:cell division protein FtsB